MSGWHERVLPLITDSETGGRNEQEPGTLWEQLASGIYLENMDAPNWAWADARSVWLLDFWARFDRHLNFVLVSTTPQHSIAAALDAGVTADALAAVLTQWEAYHQELLRFHHRNPKRSIIVDASQCASAPQGLVEAIAARWQVALPAADAATVRATHHDTLASYLAAQASRDYPQLSGLQHELEATANLFAPPPPTADLTAAVAGYATLRKQLAGAAETEKRAAAMAVQLQESEQQNAVQERAMGQLQHALDDKELARFTAAQAATSLRQENAMLLSQLHDVQESLEESMVGNHALRAALADSAAAQEAQTTLDQANREWQHRLAEREAHWQQHFDELNRDWTERLTTMQEAWTEGLQCAEQEWAAKLDQTAQQERGRGDASEQELERAQKAAGDSQQEVELLMMQLHQVQEELEHYFVLNKEADKERHALQARWQAMLARHPDYVDVESVEVVAAKQATGGARLAWRLVNLNAAGRFFPELGFDTVSASGQCWIEFARVDGRLGPLLRWPASFDPNTLQLNAPAASAALLAAPGAALSDLATSDQDLLKALCKIVIDTADRAPRQFPKGMDVATWRAQIADYLAQLQATPPLFRFDHVSLKRAQVNPDYEHLWLKLDNVSFDDQRWPRVELRVSCANVGPKRFGTHPKLEFPASEEKGMLEKWFVESYDDFGEKLELRFAMPDSMDISVWAALSEQDHALLTSMIGRLPFMLARLESDGAKIARPWEEWRRMVLNVGEVLTLRTGVPAAAVQPASSARPAAPRKTAAKKSAPQRASGIAK